MCWLGIRAKLTVLIMFTSSVLSMDFEFPTDLIKQFGEAVVVVVVVVVGRRWYHAPMRVVHLDKRLLRLETTVSGLDWG